MANDLFKKRMQLHGLCLGEKQITTSNMAEIATFRNDVNYRQGMIYDWDMMPIETVEFKFEKINTFSFEKKAVEYMVRFKPDCNPEFDYRNRHFRKDGKERLGFYLDVYDYGKQKYDKWLIVGKDDRTLFDRYTALKCNWMFEWLDHGKYRRCLGVARDVADSSFNSTNRDVIGGTAVSGSTSFILPYNIDTAKITVGQCFIFSDNIEFPQVFKVDQIKDNTVAGVIRYYTSEILFNKHRDYVGEVNGKDHPFAFETPIPDLPEEYGGSLHMLCDALYETPGQKEEPVYDGEIELETNAHGEIYINGSSVTITSNTDVYQWKIRIDNEEYPLEDLKSYFEISEDQRSFEIRAIHKDMAQYVLAVSAMDYSGAVSEEVRMVVKT